MIMESTETALLRFSWNHECACASPHPTSHEIRDPRETLEVTNPATLSGAWASKSLCVFHGLWRAKQLACADIRNGQVKSRDAADWRRDERRNDGGQVVWGRIFLNTIEGYYQSVETHPQLSARARDPGLGGFPILLEGGGPIGYVSWCILMYPACILHVSWRIHVSLMYPDVSQM